MKAILPPKDSVQGRGGQIIVLTLTRLLLPLSCHRGNLTTRARLSLPLRYKFSFILRSVPFFACDAGRLSVSNAVSNKRLKC